MKGDEGFVEDLKRSFSGVVRRDEPLSHHTAFRIGGPADFFVVPETVKDLRRTILLSKDYSLPVYVIGNGTKMLFGDGGFRGVIVKISNVLDSVQFSEEGVLVGSGLAISRLSVLAADNSFSGLEFAVGIPGTVGGAVIMNAGAHGHSISDVLKSVTVMKSDGDIAVLPKNELVFSYRYSSLQGSKNIVVALDLVLERADSLYIKSKNEEYIQWRRNAQRIGFPNAGSVFKNPAGDSAGRLIESLGLKGKRLGNAQVSTAHANFIVNLGKATAEDVLSLLHLIQAAVKKEFGIQLSPEIRIVAED